MQGRVLVVQTDDSISKILDSRYQMIVKKDGLEAIEWLDKGNGVDLIIADAAMPYLSSIDFIKEIRSRFGMNRTPIMVISDLAQITERIVYKQAGANDFLVKPFSKAQVKQRISQLLAHASEKAA